VGREMRDLLPPAQVIAAQPVGEEERRAAAGDLVVEMAEGPLQASGSALRCAVRAHRRPLQKTNSVEPTTPSGHRPAANNLNLLSKSGAAVSASRATASW